MQSKYEDYINCGSCNICCKNDYCEFAQDLEKVLILENDIKYIETMDDCNGCKKDIIAHLKREIKLIKQKYGVKI